MTITLLDVVIHKVGQKDTYTGEDFAEANVPMFGGCQGCGASIAGYNAYPSRTGFIRCTDCIGSMGFDTVDEFHAWESAPADPDDPDDVDS